MDAILYKRVRQFDVAVSLNHVTMTSFWLNKWARTPKYDPSSVGITVWGYCHMSMDIIPVCVNTLCMSNVDAGSSLRHLSASTMTQWHHFDSTSDHVPQNLTQVVGCNCLRLLPYTHGQHINVLKLFYMSNMDAGRQFEVAVSLNHNTMKSFWLHKWASRGSSTRFIKFSNSPNTISECSNLLYSFTIWYPESLKKQMTITCLLGVSNVTSEF